MVIRYFLNVTVCCDSQSADMDVSDNGDYYRVEDVDLIIADRDIKAANLKSLVDMVLAIEVNSQDNFDPYTVRDAIVVAQGLKQ